jgi:polar amino acid transport system substrate-binding protein
MNKLLKLVQMIIFLAFLYATHSFSAEKIIVVTELSPPYQTIENNIIGGSATEKVKLYLKSKNIDFEIRMYPWARAYKLATTQKNIMIYGMVQTKKREELFDWLIPVYEFKPYLVGLNGRNDLKITNLEQAKIFTIAIPRDDFAHEYLLSKGFEENKNIILTNSIVDAWRLVKNKKVDFLIEDTTFEPVIDGKKIENEMYEKYLFLPELNKKTYLASSKLISSEVKTQLNIATELADESSKSRASNKNEF